jgi:hypothetical protein
LREDLAMKKSQFTDQQVAFALKQAEGGTPVCPASAPLRQISGVEERRISGSS